MTDASGQAPARRGPREQLQHHVDRQQGRAQHYSMFHAALCELTGMTKWALGPEEAAAGHEQHRHASPVAARPARTGAVSGWPTRTWIAAAALCLALAGCTLPGGCRWLTRPPRRRRRHRRAVRQRRRARHADRAARAADGAVEELATAAGARSGATTTPRWTSCGEASRRPPRGSTTATRRRAAGRARRTTWQLAPRTTAASTRSWSRARRLRRRRCSACIRRIFELRPQAGGQLRLARPRRRRPRRAARRRRARRRAGHRAARRCPVRTARRARATSCRPTPRRRCWWRSRGAPTGQLTETTRVYADGRNVSVKGGAEEEQRRYTADEVRAIEAAIEQVGWASLPDPLLPS